MSRIYILAKADLAKAMAEELSKRGHDPIWSDDPMTAFCQIITFRSQLVLAEYLDVDGEWLCREIRKLKQLAKVQVIMMSELGKNRRPEDIRPILMAFGANGYLPKPFPSQEIGDYVQSWLRAS